MTVTQETQQVLGALERVETVERVAASFQPNDARRLELLKVVADSLAALPPVRPVIAARWLKLSEPTIRAWVREGVLDAAVSKPRLLLDAKRLHTVRHLVDDLRAAGKCDGLLDAVYRRLVDATWLDNEDLYESLEQMRRGEYTVVRDLADNTA